MRQSQPIVFSMETLIAATENFRDENKIEEGGFGPVYKVTGIRLQNVRCRNVGCRIKTIFKLINTLNLSRYYSRAVKSLYSQSMQGKKEFLSEIKLVGEIRHRNLVDILGSCLKESERLLVYEYLANKNLDETLFSG